jgi:hypothetical protein
LKERNSATNPEDVSPSPPMYSPMSGSSSQQQQQYNDSTESVDSMDILLVSKKRQRRPEIWQRNIRKERVNKGLNYVNVNRIEVEGKSLKEPCSMSCKTKCRENITQEQRHAKPQGASAVVESQRGAHRRRLRQHGENKIGFSGERLSTRFIVLQRSGEDS